MPTGAKNVLYIRDLGMATYNLLNFKMRLVDGISLESMASIAAVIPPKNALLGIYAAAHAARRRFLNTPLRQLAARYGYDLGLLVTPPSHHREIETI